MRLVSLPLVALGMKEMPLLLRSIVLGRNHLEHFPHVVVQPVEFATHLGLPLLLGKILVPDGVKIELTIVRIWGKDQLFLNCALVEVECRLFWLLRRCRCLLFRRFSFSFGFLLLDLGSLLLRCVLKIGWKDVSFSIA